MSAKLRIDVRGLAAAALIVTACGARTALELDPGAGPASVEHCDAVDEDADGRIDEGLALAPVGELIRIRTDEGGSRACTRCGLALSVLCPTRRGMVSIMRVYNEDRPAPVLRRRLDSAGRPLETWDATLGEVSMDWFPSTHWARGVDGVVLGTYTDEDGPLITSLDADGARVMGPAPIPFPPGRGPGRWQTPQIARRDDGTFVAAMDCDLDVCLAVIDERGTPLGSWALGDRSALLPRRDVVGVSGPVLTHHDGRIGVAVIQVRGGDSLRPELLFFLLDADGTARSEQRVALPLPDFEYVPLDTVRILADDEGFLVTFLARDCALEGRRGRWVAHFDRDGRLVDGPTNHEPDWCFFGSEWRLQRRIGGGVLMSGLWSLMPSGGIDDQQSFVAQLDDRGRLEWARALDRPLHAVLELDDGRVFAALSARWEPPSPNVIDVVELGCEP